MLWERSSSCSRRISASRSSGPELDSANLLRASCWLRSWISLSFSARSCATSPSSPPRRPSAVVRSDRTSESMRMRLCCVSDSFCPRNSTCLSLSARTSFRLASDDSRCARSEDTSSAACCNRPMCSSTSRSTSVSRSVGRRLVVILAMADSVALQTLPSKERSAATSPSTAPPRMASDVERRRLMRSAVHSPPTGRPRPADPPSSRSSRSCCCRARSSTCFLRRCSCSSFSISSVKRDTLSSILDVDARRSTIADWVSLCGGDARTCRDSSLRRSLPRFGCCDSKPCDRTGALPSAYGLLS
mmetsp:Transcript_16515/g.35784  ORF Transcript_16515/g.35784 Transcript_16515/m.35784 type:complete len:302 (+) Transcript_16515:1002-1907(+)